MMRPVPFLRWGLLAIGGVYFVRGLTVIPDIIRLVQGAGYPLRQAIFSAIALLIGLSYLAGAARRWNIAKAG